MALGIDADALYESLTIPFTQPAKRRKYKPDLPLPNGVIVEFKGRFVTADRQKLAMVKTEHPDLDIRLVFSNPNARISKQSKTSYGAWASAHGFPFAKETVPDSWLRERPNRKSLAAIRRLQQEAV